eukprot:GFYU01005607.1.p1 GENE.GFYU01005607.1~~GFYU01005607.1.p1  ORF type:complete len:444 (-),score=88.29 GFYU01005607.1:116-1447(-)
MAATQTAQTPRTLYRRPLPEGLVAFSSCQGRRIFSEALAESGLGGYFTLAEQFTTQAEPAFCGLGTLVMILNALHIDPNRVWRGPWRWFAEELLNCCKPLEEIKEKGITVSEFACLGRCNGLEVKFVSYDTSSEDAFRKAVKEWNQAMSRAPTHCDGRDERDSHVDFYIAVSYSRKTLGQTGDGHFSPIGGYNEQRDMVLVFDVARFKYPPYWTPLSLLWKSMEAPDPETGKSRGWFRMRRAPSLEPALLFNGAITTWGDWRKYSGRWDHFIERLCELAESRLEDIKTAQDFADLVVSQLDFLVAAAVEGTCCVPKDADTLGEEHARLIRELLVEIRALPLFELIGKCAAAQCSGCVQKKALCVEVVTIFTLALPKQALVAFAEEESLHAELLGLLNREGMSSALINEISWFENQVLTLNEEMTGGDDAVDESEQGCNDCACK